MSAYQSQFAAPGDHAAAVAAQSCVAIAHTAEQRQRSLRSLAQNHALQGGETYRTENTPLKAFVSRFVDIAISRCKRAVAHIEVRGSAGMSILWQIKNKDNYISARFTVAGIHAFWLSGSIDGRADRHYVLRID
jgi:hypothetical protein